MRLSRWELALAAAAILAAVGSLAPIRTRETARWDMVLLAAVPVGVSALLLLLRERRNITVVWLSPYLEGMLRYAAMFGTLAATMTVITTVTASSTRSSSVGAGLWLIVSAVVAGMAAGFLRGQLSPVAATGFTPVWVSLASPVDYPDGTRLEAETWYLATSMDGDGYVLSLGDEREVFVPAELVHHSDGKALGIAASS